MRGLLAPTNGCDLAVPRVYHSSKSRPSPRLRLLSGLTLVSTFTLAGVTPVALAQGNFNAPAGAVVQTVPSNDSMSLNAALARLGRNPRDVDALIDAGNAALVIGDVDASIGFFSRADQVTPGNVRIRAGLASALVHSGNPVEAIPLFEEVERSGPMDAAATLDRGLAYDLVGDSATAQGFYRQVLARGPNDEALRRLAISQAIAGDKRGSAGTLTPLLTRQDKAAWRARAFALAILGQPDDAIAVVNTTLPAALASGIAPYLRYMPRLTPAQQAAAANFGQFPRASEIGRDDPRIARYSASQPRRPSVAAVDTSLIPKGEPLGRKGRDRDRDRDRDRNRRGAASDASNPQQANPALAAADPRQLRDPRLAAPNPQPARAATPAPMLTAPGLGTPLPPGPAVSPVQAPFPAPVPVRQPLAPAQPQVGLPPAAAPAATPARPAPTTQLAITTAAQMPPVASAASAPSVAPAAVSTPVAPTAAVPAPVASRSAVAAPGFSLSGPASTYSLPPASASSAPLLVPAVAAPAAPPAQPAAPTPPVAVPAAAPGRAAPQVPAPSRRASLAEAFSDLAKPAIDVAPAAGAVDVRRIRPARTGPAVAAAPDKPAPPSHPSRIWVQLATGRDKAALGFDWRRMVRQSDAVFKGKKASVSAWGQSNRLLAGPFESEAAASAFVTQLRRADIDGAFVWTSPAGQVVDALAGR